MPIKIYQRQIGPAALPAAAQTAGQVVGASGAELGPALESVAGVVSKIADAEREKADAAILMKSEAQADEARRAALKRLEELRGEDAVAKSDEVLRDLDTALTEIRSNLPRDRHRLRFDQLRQRVIQGMASTVDRHVAKENERAYLQAYDGVIESATANTIEHGASKGPGFIEEERFRVAAAVEQHIARMGLKQEAAEAERRRALSPFHAAAIQAINESEGPEEARRYLSEHSDEIQPAALKRIQESIRVANVNQQALGLSEGLVKKFQVSDFSFDLIGAKKALRELKVNGKPITDNVELFDAAMERLERHARSVRMAAADNDREKLGQIQQDFAQGRLRSLASVKRHPAFAFLSESGRGVALSQWKAAKAAGKRAQLELDSILRNEWLALPPKDRLAVDIDTDPALKDMSPRARSKLKAIQQRMREGLGESETDFRKAVNAYMAEDVVMSRSGRTREEFLAAAVSRYYDFLEEHKKKPEPGDREKIIADLRREVEVKGRFWGTNRKEYWKALRDKDEIIDPDTGKPEGKLEIGDISAADKAKIIGIFKKRGKPNPSDDEILRFYKFATGQGDK